MNHMKVISLDMFQTLVNIQGRNKQIWTPILQQAYSDEQAIRYGAEVLGHFIAGVDFLRQTGGFRLSHDLFKHSYEQVFRQNAIPYSPAQAVEHLFAEHRRAPMYPETEGFLQKVCREYQVCIVSDTDILMLPEFYKSYPITLFASEHYGSYKNDSNNLMFDAVIEHYGVEPGEIVHIGDSPSDVLGAARTGIRSCWLNRNGAEWKDERLPDWSIRTLDELFDII